MVTRSSIDALLRGHWYDALASVLACVLAEEELWDVRGDVERAHHLAVTAKRVLDLDAEDFGAVSQQWDRPWAPQVADASFPHEPDDPKRGALGSLTRLYELMLEVLDLRSQRHESQQVVVTAHLIGEYLPLLAWESTLGHAGDPQRMRTSVGDRWGSDSRDCPHTSSQRAAAKRSVNAGDSDRAGFTAYLDKFHSRLGDALAVCGMNHDTVRAGQRPDVATTCPNPCRWAVAGDLEDRRDLDARLRLALIYRKSPVVALRHHAPVGHFFGVPSTREIADAWVKTYAKLSAPWQDGTNPLLLSRTPGAPEPDEALPGLSAVVSAVAGRTIGPGRVIRSIAVDIAEALAPVTVRGERASS